MRGRRALWAGAAAAQTALRLLTVVDSCRSRLLYSALSPSLQPGEIFYEAYSSENHTAWFQARLARRGPSARRAGDGGHGAALAEARADGQRGRGAYAAARRAGAHDRAHHP